MTPKETFLYERQAIVAALEKAGIHSILLNKDSVPTDLPAAIVALNTETGKLGTSRRFASSDLDFSVYIVVNAHEVRDPDADLYHYKEAFREAYRAAMAKMPTPKLTQVLHDAVTRHAPPKSGFFRPKPKYAHQGGSNPPIIVIHGNHLEVVNNTYKRYLENTFREHFQLMGTPLKVEFKGNVNPYEGKKAAPLTERELKKVHRDHRRRRRMFG